MTFVTFHRTPDDPIIPEGIPIPGPRPSRPDHPPVSEPDSPPPPAKEPPAPARRDQLAGMRRRLSAQQRFRCPRFRGQGWLGNRRVAL
jgi:hypothetical protein